MQGHCNRWEPGLELGAGRLVSPQPTLAVSLHLAVAPCPHPGTQVSGC